MELPAGFGPITTPKQSSNDVGWKPVPGASGAGHSAGAANNFKIGPTASPPTDWSDSTVSGPAAATASDQRSSGGRASAPQAPPSRSDGTATAPRAEQPDTKPSPPASEKTAITLPDTSPSNSTREKPRPSDSEAENFDPVTNRASRYAHLLQGSSFKLPTQQGAKKKSSLSLKTIVPLVVAVLVVGGAAVYFVGQLSHKLSSSNNGNHEQAGDDALKQGNLTAAFEEYDDAVSESPNNPDLLHKRGNVEMALQQYRRAADDFDSAHKLDEQDRGLLLDHAAALIWLHEYDKAILDYNQILAKESANAKAYFGRSLAYRKMRELQKALADLKKATTLDPAYAEAFSEISSIYYQLGDYKEALKTADTALRLQPRSGHNYFNKATALRKLGRRQEAENAYSSALRYMPGAPESFNDRGFTYLELGAKPQALRDFRSAIELAPDCDIAQKNLKAVSSRLISGAGAKDPHVQANAALGYLGMGQTAQALETGRRAATAAPRDPYVLEIAGECELASKNYKEAIAALGAAAGFGPALADAHFFRARAFLQDRQFRDAVAEYSAYISAAAKSGDPSFADHIAFAFIERALAYDALGQGAPAAEDAQRYLGMSGWNYPTSGTAALLAWLGCKETDQKAQAAKMLDNAAIYLPAGLWPSPVVSFLRRVSSESDMLSDAAKSNAEMTDAHTWLAFDNQFEGLTGKSKDNFDWVEKNGNPETYTYILSSSRFSR